MDKINTQFLWIGTHGSISVEPKNQRVNAGRCSLEQKYVCNLEPAFKALHDDDVDDDDEEDDAHRLPASGHVEDNVSWEDLSLEDAVALLDDLHQLPSVDNLIILLRKCRKQRNSRYAMRINMHVLSQGLESHALIGNFLVPTLVHCGRISDAQSVFNRLTCCNEHAWTALIFGYVDEGNPEKAVDLGENMLEHGATPSRHTYVGLLNACARLKQLARGRILHAKIIEEHYENDLFIGNALLDMYAKCGSLPEAQRVFDMMPLRDVVSWTTLLGGFADHGLGHGALTCLAQMRKENVLFNLVTFVCGLKACANLSDLEKGQLLHEEIVVAGYEEDLYVSNALVDMYSKCHHIQEGRSVFDMMPTRDEVSWNTLITGYAKYGLDDEAFTCWKQMKEEGKSPNVVTFVSLLKACSKLEAFDRGKEIHSEIEKEGLNKNLLVRNALLDMYFRCGSVAEAERCFQDMPIRDVVSWTTLMTGYVECGLAGKALSCFRAMQQEGFKPDAVAYLLSLRSCSSLQSLEIGRELHAEIDRAGYSGDLAIANSLVDMYAKCGSLEDAQEVFHTLPTRNVISWTALIAGSTESGVGKGALELFEKMKREGVPPNTFTYACILKACGCSRAIRKGLKVHREIITEGYEEDHVVANSLIDMYAKFGFLKEAEEAFNELLTRDVISWTALINGYASLGFLEKASKHFVTMQMEGIIPESISFNPLIMGYSKKGDARKPLNLFNQMGEKGVLPDRVTFLSILKACENGTSLEMGRRIHAQVHVLGDKDVTLLTMLIGMYSKIGSITDSQKVFDAIERKDCIAWTALMKAYARKKDNRHVLHLFERMRQEGVEPDGITFEIVLNACRTAKFVDKGWLYFDLMTKEYGITPTAEHRDSMVDLLERSGQVDQAVAILLL